MMLMTVVQYNDERIKLATTTTSIKSKVVNGQELQAASGL
jgi:hypothetical protein